jgi:WhiB family transcriptional regulator, redox-sensing transcriptional regulator
MTTGARTNTGPGVSPMHADPRAACTDLTTDQVEQLFWPLHDDGPEADAAKAICRSCTLVDDCRTWALETRQPYGIWGATTPDERRTILAGTLGAAA